MNSPESITATFAAIPNLVVNTNTDDAGNAADCTPQPAPGSNTTDSACSLRDALAFAAASATPFNISFDSTAFSAANSAAANTILLEYGTLNVASNVSINGATSGTGASLTNLVTIDGNLQSTVFTFNNTATNAGLSALAITHGDGNGAGILNNGTLTVSNSTISANFAAYGGGIYNNGTLTLINSTVSNNSAVAGAGIVNNGGTMTLTQSTISGNQASEFAGGIWGINDVETLTGSTVSNNYSLGGANDAGGIYFNGSTASLANTIVAANWDDVSDSFSESDIAGNYTDNGGNLVSPYFNPAPLGNYGGATQTIPPLPYTKAICGGLMANATGLTTDQRGLPRTTTYAGTPCVDSGAVQSNYAISFAVQPPTEVAVGLYFAPPPAVEVTESGNPVTSYSSPLNMTDNDSQLINLQGPEIFQGYAAFNYLYMAAVESSDKLLVTLPLNPYLNPQLTITAASNSFTAVPKLSQKITFPKITGTNYVGGSVSLTVTVSSGLPVTLLSTHTNICTVSASGGSSWTVALAAAGRCTIKASQPGGTYYLAAPNVTRSFTVHLNPQTVTFPAVPAPEYVNGAPIPLAATATSGLALSYVSSTTGICTVTNSSGWSVSLIAIGKCTIEAQQAGDSFYAAAPNVTQSFNILGNPQTISFAAVANPEYITNPPSYPALSLSATASSGLAVTLASATPTVCMVAGTTATLLAKGSCKLTAAQAGDSNWAAAPTVTQTLTVDLDPQSISFAPIATQTVGVLLAVSATATSGLTVVFTSTTTGVCTVTGATASMLKKGTCTLKSAQPGDSTYAAATAVTQSFMVVP